MNRYYSSLFCIVILASAHITLSSESKALAAARQSQATAERVAAKLDQQNDKLDKLAEDVHTSLRSNKQGQLGPQVDGEVQKPEQIMEQQETVAKTRANSEDLAKLKKEFKDEKNKNLFIFYAALVPLVVGLGWSWTKYASLKNSLLAIAQAADTGFIGPVDQYQAWGQLNRMTNAIIDLNKRLN